MLWPKIPVDHDIVPCIAALEAPYWHQLVQKDKGINPGWSTSVLKGFHQPQTLICLAILPQLVHREERFRWFGINSNQCDTLKIKYAIFPKPDQKSLEVCGKNSSGFPKAESGSIIHESCFHDIRKKKTTVFHCSLPYLDLYFICPWGFNALIPAKICGYKISTVTSLLSLPRGTDIHILIPPEMHMILKSLRSACANCVFVGAATEQRLLKYY